VTGVATFEGRAPRRRLVRVGGLSFRINLRVLTMLVLSTVLLLGLACWAMTLGSFHIPVADVVRTLLGDGTKDTDFIVKTLRLPRTLVAILAGISLGFAGGIFQGVVRNPLASPDIIGIDAGATLLAVIWILTGQDRTYLIPAAFLGATITAMAIYLLSWRGGISGDRLILMGIGVTAVLGAFTTFLMLRYPVEFVSQALLWTSGSLNGSSWDDVRSMSVGLGLLAVPAVGLMWALRVLQFGDDMAKSLGMRVELTRLALIVAGSGLAATSVAICGPIGFVALLVPHTARMLAGPMTGAVLLLAGIIGALLLLGSDIVAQHALPVGLPVGVVTSAVGAPYFLFLLYRARATV